MCGTYSTCLIESAVRSVDIIEDSDANKMCLSMSQKYAKNMPARNRDSDRIRSRDLIKGKSGKAGARLAVNCKNENEVVFLLQPKGHDFMRSDVQQN